MRTSFVLGLLGVGVALVATLAHAGELHPLAREELAPLAGIASHGELALVQSNPDGTMRQVTLIVLVRAPADAVRALVADVGGYLKFVPNLKQADFHPDEHRQLVNTWRLELPIATFSGRDAYEIDPAPLGPIRLRSLDTLARYQWDFIPVEEGVLLVHTGYADVLHANRFVRAVLKRQSALEHGLALAAQYMLVSAVKHEAERRAGSRARATIAASGAALERLSTHGQVVIMRANPDGRLVEVSAIDHIYAPEEKVMRVLADPSAYAEFIAGVDRSLVINRAVDQITYELDMALPIVTWSTTFQMQIGAHAIDGAGVEGDLRGARYRWDLSSRGPKETLATYRANMPLSRGSFLIRKLFDVDPSLEHGINVAFALLQLRSVRGRAEGWITK